MRDREIQPRRFAPRFVLLAAGSALGLGAVDCATNAPAAPASDARPLDAAAAPEDGGPGGEPGADASAAAPTLSVSSPAVDFSAVSCGASATSALVVQNTGTSPVTVSATVTGAGFAVSPSVLALGVGASSALNLTAAVPGSAIAGSPMVGSLDLASDAEGWKPISVPLSVTPSGAVLSFGPGQGTTFAFPLTEVGYAAGLSLALVNVGNAPATFSVGAPSDPHFSLPAGTGLSLPAGGTWTMSVDFTATDTAPVYASSPVSVTGATCGASLATLTYSGAGTTGRTSGWPAILDFGAADCGGSAPPQRSFTLANAGGVDAHIVKATLTGAPGFTTTARAGLTISTHGATTIYVHAPPVPVPSYSSSPITATLSIETDSEASPHAITLAEEPNGAILAFDASGTPGFGSFGRVPLLSSSSQEFRVVNLGSAAAHASLVASPTSAFAVSIPDFAIGAGGIEEETATFAPTAVGGVAGAISMTATGVLCAPLPAPIPLSGQSAAAPVVSPAALTFGAVCGGAAPPPQTVTVTNGGDGDVSWSMTGLSGSGAARYALFATPPPGTLIPGASAAITVTAAPMPSPAPDTAPSAFSAQFTIATDVPFDPPHVITLGETPLGDQLAFASSGPVRFGQVPVGTTLAQAFAVANNASPGSPPAALSFSIQGSGAGAYAVQPGIVASLPSGGAVTAGERIAFAPTSTSGSAATLAISTTDPLCTPLPPPLQMNGTGTQGAVALSAATLTFGTDPADAGGRVDCGKTGLPQTLTVSNLGNQTLNVTGLSLGKGASSPYTLSGGASALPAYVPIGGSATLVVTPAQIPQTVPDPGDPTPFSDTLTIVTDAAGDLPHAVSLVMQARGAVVADTPLATTWDFGTVPLGSIGTFTRTITNTGNGGVSIVLAGLLQPAVFGLQNNPTSAGPGEVTSIVGRFTPPTADGSWSDQATLSVTATGAFCAPLPTQWRDPVILFSGRSNTSP